MLDTSGFCQVGRYGTLSLLKRQCGSMDDDVVASFGIDDEELTFGSSTTCGVRLYYPDVGSLHCKIVFDQYKVCTLFIILYKAEMISGVPCHLGWVGCCRGRM